MGKTSKFQHLPHKLGMVQEESFTVHTLQSALGPAANPVMQRREASKVNAALIRTTYP
jgi:hypothetical protein